MSLIIAGTHNLQLLPRPNNSKDRKLVKKYGSLGILTINVTSNLPDHLPMPMSDYHSVHVEVCVVLMPNTCPNVGKLRGSLQTQGVKDGAVFCIFATRAQLRPCSWKHFL